MRHWEALAISIICMIKGSHTRTGNLNCLHSEHSQENMNIMTKSLHSQTLYHLKSMEEDDICELLKKDADKARKTRGGQWETWADDEEATAPEVKPEDVRKILAMFGK